MLSDSAFAEAAPQGSCETGNAHLASLELGAVQEVKPGPIIHVEGGSELRLAGLLVPRTPRSAKDAEGTKAATVALSHLRKVLTGARLKALPAVKADRHGRKWAQLFVNSGDGLSYSWLQADLVAAGIARVSPAARGSACAKQLLEIEKRARSKKVGIWTQKKFAELEAWATRKLRRRENSFQLVRGVVADVAETKRMTYVNFGKDWRTDFTVNISPRAAKRFKASGFSPVSLKGKTVRVRGWVSYANGPMIRVRSAEQIEIIDP